MIIDVTGIRIIPGNGGRDCPGNGEHFGENGEVLVCCCDECDYLLCCINIKYYEECKYCSDINCDRKNLEIVI